MRYGMRFGAVLAVGLALGGCAMQPAASLPNPEQVAMHEWDHGPPWGPEEQPWVAPPPTYAYLPGPYDGPGYWWGPSVGLGIGLGFGRGSWWRGHHGHYGGWHGGWRGGGWRGGHVHGGRGRR